MPDGWTLTELGSIVEEKVHQQEPTKLVPYIDIGSVNRSTKTIGRTSTVRAGSAPTRARQWVREKDILVSLTRPNLNAVAMVPPTLGSAVASTGFDVLRPHRVLPEWILLRVRSTEFVMDVCKGLQGVVYPAIRPRDVRAHRIPIPPLAEQGRIVEVAESCLSRIDEAEAALERVQRNLKRYRAAVLQAAVEGRLVPTEAEFARVEGRPYEHASESLGRLLVERRRRWEDGAIRRMKLSGKSPTDDAWRKRYRPPATADPLTLPTVPEGWCWATVEAISTKVVDGVHQKPEYVETGVPFITVKNLTAGPGISFDRLNYITEEAHAEYIRRADPAEGDILISKDGTLGVIRAVRTSRTFSIFVSVALVRPVTRDLTDYLEIALSSPVVQRQMVPKGSGLQHIHLEDLRRDCIPIPPASEQLRIVAECRRLLSLAEAVESAAAGSQRRLARTRNSILKWAFEGRLVDQDPNDEPASVLLERIRTERAATQENRPRRKKVLDTISKARRKASRTVRRVARRRA